MIFSHVKTDYHGEETGIVICKPDVEYIPWQDDVPEIKVG